MTGLGYTLPAVTSVPAVVALDVFVLRTGLFRRVCYWITMVIVFGFQVLVDGVLTWLPEPVVVYDPGHISGLRFPFDIPVEDFFFGFSLVTLALLGWVRLAAREEAGRDDGREGGTP